MMSTKTLVIAATVLAVSTTLTYVHGGQGANVGEQNEPGDAQAVYAALERGGVLTLTNEGNSSTYLLTAVDRWDHSHDGERWERIVSFRLTQDDTRVGRLVMTPEAARIGFATDAGPSHSISVPDDRGTVSEEAGDSPSSGPNDGSARCSVVYELIDARPGDVHLRWRCN